ncbi:cytochrome c oxidase subunit II [Zooshikella ganghwensis]|uniref:cytochrome c oxidase subunit II n=1 Tax=Zooshikella ganghwensis TaxID=202772 RepID=UPI0003FD366F|nr:cytochrome c oxidase subunit II [Zooshikella ganghwensis]
MLLALRQRQLLGLGLLWCTGYAQADWAANMREGVTAVSQSIYNLHMTIFWICVVIGIVVFGVMFWSMLMHRKSRGAKPATFHENTLVEIIWTTIPFFILVGMAIPASKTLIEAYDASEAEIDIKITGYQWKWKYDYLNEKIGFFSNLSTHRDEINNLKPKNANYLLEVDEPVVVPVDKKVRFLITSADVIHSWWVPDLAVKKDAIPGFINEAWTKIEKPGVYRGQCAELCGKDHGFMPIVIEAKTEDDYKLWLAAKQEQAEKEKELTTKEWSMEELMARGEKVYNTACAVCHQANGEGMPPVFPALKDSPLIMTGDVKDHIDIIVNGKQGTAMQAFGKQLSEVDIAAVTTYERNAWGNNKGDMVTPQDIVKFNEAAQ